ncbi:aminotransferase class III-fold pyridoxal phosphate-dependent enzyme [Salinicola tamaricis]|uniref:aminotransferase class III-fold pyridoxal phosphate-dependent enzyme n=1 Tax=Salinicola tamaricis TaxID=1771309 RepID=UPI002413DABE|nr:aminotransferase class III-fold pyridoxal phosphate-dependent enzyme [Salinicola tamaricis]
MIVNQRIAHHFDDEMFYGGLTYSGHPLAMAAICATLETMQEEGIVDNARQIGETVLSPGLARLAQRHAHVGEVRGLGVFHAIELVEDRDSRTPLAAAKVGKLKQAMMEHGLLAFVVANRIHVVPPCIVTADEAEQGLAIIDEALGTLG